MRLAIDTSPYEQHAAAPAAKPGLRRFKLLNQLALIPRLVAEGVCFKDGSGAVMWLDDGHKVLYEDVESAFTDSFLGIEWMDK